MFGGSFSSSVNDHQPQSWPLLSFNGQCVTLREGNEGLLSFMGNVDDNNNYNSNTMLYSYQQEIKAVVRSHNEEYIPIILSHETHAHTHS